MGATEEHTTPPRQHPTLFSARKWSNFLTEGSEEDIRNGDRGLLISESILYELHGSETRGKNTWLQNFAAMHKLRQ